MIHNVLTHLGGIGVYGVISICLFFAVFVGVLVWAFRLKKPFLNAMSAMPLEDDPDSRSVSDSKPKSHPAHE